MSEFAINQYLKEVERVIHFGGTTKETSIRNAFHNLLNTYASRKGLMVVPEITIKTAAGKNVTPDGTIKDSLRQDWGYWESKDESDIIDEEISKKFAKGYPKDNILFEDSKTAVLIQNGNEVLRVKFSDVSGLDHLLNEFVNFEPPRVTSFRKAIELFKADIPKVTDTIRDLLDVQEKENPKFVKERNKFLKLCQESINPEVTKADVREMIIQHILTEDIFNTIFDETQFHRENNVARQLEGVIHTFFTGATKKTALATLQHYSQAINAAAAGIADHHEKQKFLKVVYETFYKSYNPKAADRLGVVYTPNEVVKFMIESTDYLLHNHFGKYLEDKGVEILDPATGTGTFICDIIDYIRKEKLEHKYKNEIHANEVAILPYYISNLNIEFTYTQKMGKYSEFENLCFVDTLDNLGFAYRGKQINLFEPFTEENSKRIYKQNTKKISVVIGNPPYNANQSNENDNNKNREYPEIDKRIKDTYIKQSTAQKTKLYDMYARFLRWASDRLDENGIVAFISNNSFINSRTFDGFRKTISSEFNSVYIINLKGNATTSGERRKQEGGNIFNDQIRVGVAVYFLVKKKGAVGCNIYYDEVPDYAKAPEKLQFISERKFANIPFERIQPDKKNNWIDLADSDFENLLPLCNKTVKTGSGKKALFELFSLGVITARDEWVYGIDQESIDMKMKHLIRIYNRDVINHQNKTKEEIRNAVDYSIKWSRAVKNDLSKGKKYEFNSDLIVDCAYRPFVRRKLYFSKELNEMQYQLPKIFRESGNMVIGFRCQSAESLVVLSTDIIFDYAFLKIGNGGTFSLPLFRYDEKGNRIDNITEWGLNQFVKQYGTKGITRETIFNYTYGVLHNPAYAKKYELDLKREFPRIPFYKDFKKWSDWGKALMELHNNYETVKPFALKEVTAKGIEKPKCKLKADKEAGTIILDDETTLTGVPAEAWNYKLGNRSALEWVLDQYKEKKPSDPTILEKFNTYKFADYKDHVIDLLKRVCTVSVETMKIIREMEASNE